MESATVGATEGIAADQTAPGNKGLKAGALGYLSNLVIAISGASPAYSLAATLGVIVVVKGVGVHAPAVLLASFIPILFVSIGYRFFNLADPDAGTTFAWVTRAFGPQLGWINGWAIFLADVIGMASLSAVASRYTYLLVGWKAAADSNLALIIGAVLWIALMTWVCYRGIELSGRVQTTLLAIQVLTLLVFALIALIKVYASSPAGSIHVSASWFNPFDLSWGSLINAMLLGIFIYWGWDAGVAVNEESQDSTHGPGRAAVVSTLLLVVIYLSVSTAAQALHGPGFLTQHSGDVLDALGKEVFGSPLDKLLVFAVLLSAAAATQTTILPTARTTLSMAKWKAVPEAFARVSPRFMTPSFSTLLFGGLAIVWTACLLGFNSGDDVLADTVSALGFAVCFYYGFTGIACAVYFRKDLLKSVRNFVFAGLIPLLGGLTLFAIGVKAYSYYSSPGHNHSKPLLGIETPIFVGIGGLILGVVLMFASWPFFHEFFARRWLQTADPAVLAADARRQP